MVALSRSISMVVAAVVAIGAVYALIPYIAGVGAERTASPTSTTHLPQEAVTPSTTASAAPVPHGNAWATSSEVGGLWLTSEPPNAFRPSPVYVNGTFLDFHRLRAVFNLTVGNESSNFVFSWSMSRGPYTATCYSFIDDEYVKREVSDALIVSAQYVFDDGYWFNITVYLPNASMIWAFNNPPIIRFDADATPHGAQRDVLGAVIRSSDPNSNGWWSSSQPLLSPDEASGCSPVVHGSPETDSLIDHLSLWMSLQIPEILEPLEGLGALTYLGEKTEEYFQSPNDILYHDGEVRMTYLGTEEYPGTGVVMHVYNVSFTTDTGNLVAWMKVAAESIIPLEYHAKYPRGEALQGVSVSIDIKVLDAELGTPISPE